MLNKMRISPHRTRNFFVSFVVFTVFLVFILRIVIGPFILALVLAYVFNPWIEAMERRKIRRSIVVVAALLFGFFAALVISWFLIPVLYHQIELLVHILPEFRVYLESHWVTKINEFLARVVGDNSAAIKLPRTSELLSSSGGQSSDFVSSLGMSTRFLASWGIALIIAPVFAFFMMRDFRHLSLQVLSLVPPDIRAVFIRFLTDVDQTLRAVLRGQLLVISILAVLYSVAFYIAGLPAALAVGMLTGFARLVPYLDVVVGGSLCFLILVTNASSSSVIAAVGSGFFVVQLLDAVILTPRIMGQFSGLHPFLIILSVLCFGDWFGFYGVLLAIPLAAVARVALITVLEAYKRSQFFRNGGDKLNA